MRSFDEHIDRLERDLIVSDPDAAGAWREQSASTIDNPSLGFETFELALRHPVVTDPFQSEPACVRAVELACLVGLESEPEIVEAAANCDGVPLEPGEIGPYQVLSRLGRGGMGTVYKALHRHLGKVVALKLLQPDCMQSKEISIRFQREMKAIGKLDHPHLIRALDAGDANGVQFLVMEYLDGLDLDTLIRQHGALPIAEACELVRQAALGLQAALSHGLVHRDIKPANLMLARQEFGPPIVKVLDLGLALLSETHSVDSSNLSKIGRIMGTINFMAPEQAGNSHSVDIRADIYSLGATLYSLLTGGSIFQARPHLTVIQKLSALANDTVTPIRELRPDITPELATLVHRMLARNPDERFRSPAEVSVALQPFSMGASLDALLVDEPTEDARNAKSPSPEGAAATRLGPIAARQPPETSIGPTADAELKFGRGSAGRPLGPSPSRFSPRRRPLSRIAIALMLTGIALLSVVLVSIRTQYGEIIVEVPDDLPVETAQQLRVEVTGNGDVRIADARRGWTIGVKSGTYDVQVTGGGDQILVDRQQVTVMHGKRAYVTVKRRLGSALAQSPALSPTNDVPAISPTTLPPRAIAPFSVEQAQAHQLTWANHLGVPLEFTNSIGMKFRLIPPGEFMMGSTPDEVTVTLKFDLGSTYSQEMVKSESPRHKTILTEPFYLGVHEVTQQEYVSIAAKNPSAFAATGTHQSAVADIDTAKFPVESVHWKEAVKFCSSLNHREVPGAHQAGTAGQEVQVSADGYRLPTEAEWEFACRAGTTTRYWSGEQEIDLQQAGWYRGNTHRTNMVGTKLPNPFGLYDVHGNVTEFVQDSWDTTYFLQFEHVPAINPTGANDVTGRLIRGGNWYSREVACSSTFRYSVDPISLNEFTGLRVALSVKAVRQTLERAAAHKALNASPDRRAAEWFRSLKVPRSLNVILSDDSWALIHPDLPLPVTPFRISDIELIGPEFDTLGDRVVEVLEQKLEGLHVTGVIIRIPTLTMSGMEKLVKLPALSSVRSLSLGTEKLNDGVFSVLAQCPKLTNLELQAAGNLAGEDISALKACPALTMLGIIGSRLTPEAIREIGQFPKLEYLNVDGLACSEAHIVAIGKLKVARLVMLHTGFDDKAAALLPDVETRQHLYLNNNPLTDVGLADLQRLKSLKALVLSGTQVTESGVAAFRKAMPNCAVEWEPRK
jgi:serine/threonine protein kinase/formylglycine-generating enzyme required for sulfatase activity